MLDKRVLDMMSNGTQAPIVGIIDAIFHLAYKMDEYERYRRYQDNQAKAVEQLVRLYEKGQISREQLIKLMAELTSENDPSGQPPLR